MIEFYRQKFGARLFPLRKRVLGDRSSKRPLTSWKETNYSTDELNAYLKDGHGIAWALGPNDMVIDVDAPTAERPDKKGVESLEKLYLDFPELKEVKTLEVKAPSGGRHLYYSKPNAARLKAALEDYPGIDIKTQGGYVVIAGSPHWQGGRYGFVDKSVARELCPQKLFDQVEKKKRESTSDYESETIEVDKLRKLLSLLDPIDYATNDDWFPLLCASHDATQGKGEDVFVEWCLRDSSYDDYEEEIRKRWDSLTTGGANPITLGTLVKECKSSASEDDVFEILDKSTKTNAEDDFAEFIDDDTNDIESIKDDKYQIDSRRTLRRRELKVEFIVDRVLVENEPMVLAGPEKSFKTTTLLDLSLSIAYGLPFLGEYQVAKPRKVLFFCGETSAPTIQRNAEAILKKKGITDDHDLDSNWNYSPVIPFIDKASERAELKLKVLKPMGIEVLIIDPAYFAISADQTSLQAVGEVLRSFNRLCKDLGITPIIAHHTKKGTDENRKPVHRSDITGAGFGAFMAQWMFVNLREDFKPRGFNNLWFQFGGRPFDSHTVAVDISEGKRDGDPLYYSYDVRVNKYIASNANDDFNLALKGEIVSVLSDGFATKGQIAKAIGKDPRNKELEESLAELVNDGAIVATKERVGKCPQNGYKLRTNEVQLEVF